MFKKVIVGISGGVDSAVSALLLKNKGFDVTGVFMKNWDIKDETGICQTEEDYEDAQWVCKKLEIPFVEVNFVKEYWNNIFSYLTEQYENGYTPNPDILCNKYIKFDHFFNFARTKLQADAIATGHYVRTSFGSYLEHFKPDTNVRLFHAQDLGKDQTFFLCQVPQQALRYSMFPLGGYLKKDVKQIAQEAGLDKVALKRESAGICFVGKRNFQSFISEYISDKPGEFVDLDDGRVVGKHMGFHHWTIGQNIKIGGLPAAYYVYKKDINTNDIIVVKGTHNSALYSDLVIAETPYWISSEPEFNNFSRLLNCDFRFQHRDPLVPCIVHKNLKNQLIIQLSQPLRALTEGQFVVLYNGEECLGSAVISYCGPSYYSLKQEVKMDHYRVNNEAQKIADTTSYVHQSQQATTIMTAEENEIYGCNIVYWNFLSNHEDCINRRKSQIYNKMRSASSLDQYNDDDFFSGGPCPSCRLAINKETGRLKWCMGGNDTWRFRVKLMLLIPAVLLPITIIFIALSRSQVIGKAPYHRTYLVQTRRQDERTEETFPPTSRSETERAGEEEEEDRILAPGMKTSYVPVETLLSSRQLQRHKRDLDADQPINYNVEKADDQNSDEDVYNFLDDYYTEVDADEVKENSEIQSNDYREYGKHTYDTRKNEEPRSKFFMYDNIEERSQDESDEGEQGGRHSISVDDSDTSLPIVDDQNDDDTGTDFHAFWKGEGNAWAIREAQAKIMLKYMDRSADPCEDFYQFACGNWAKHNPIPKDKAAYDTFEMIRESLDSVLKELLEDPIPKGLQLYTDDATLKAKYLYRSCMNYEILEQRMERPLIQLLDELGGWPILRPNWDPEKFDWLLLVAQLRLYNNDILISEWVAPDIKNSDQYVIQFDQTSLGLPTRDYFLQPSNTIYLKAYKNYLIKISTLLGASLQNATIDADELIEFETKLAKITSSPDERRNVSELYQRMSIGELRTLVPQINWHRYLTIVLARPTNVSEPVVVYALQYIQDLVNLLSKTSPRTIANYLLWRFVRHRVNNLDDRFQEAKQKFYYILFGREQAPSRWKNCVAQVNSNMGMAVGSMFVKKYFDEKSKNDTLAMTRDIQRSFRELLNQTTWIDDETKELATEKVNAMLLRIGYPDFILQPELLNERYKDVVIRPDKYFENTLNILQHLTRVEQDRLGSPVNKTLWNTAPAVVNAYYSRSKNRIMFPAGILQPPFYHRYFPRSLNYGGIGVVIGHEITHGFDDKGRLFDKDGNLHRWWKDEAIYGFHERAQCLIDQYSHYIVSEVGMQIDGMNTQGENIADNGGIKQAFRAYERWLRANGDADETLPGLNATGKQLFFLNFAQVWCGSMRPEATRNKLKTAVHSPGKFRVIGTLSNSEDFAEVFYCPLGAPMNPVNKCSVW